MHLQERTVPRNSLIYLLKELHGCRIKFCGVIAQYIELNHLSYEDTWSSPLS